MFDIEELLPENSVSQHSQSRSFSTSLSSHFPPPVNGREVPTGIAVIGQCKVVVNTPESLAKLDLFFRFQRIGNSPGISNFAILSYRTYFMKFLILMAFRQSIVNVVINPSNPKDEDEDE